MKPRRPGRGWLRLGAVAVFLAQMAVAGCSRESDAAEELAAIQSEYVESDSSEAQKRVSFAPRYETLANDYWGTEAALDAAIWLLQKASREGPREDRPEVVADYTDAILQEYAESPTLWKLAEKASLFTEEQRDMYFGELRQTSPHPEVRAAAIFYPAQIKARLLRPRPPGFPRVAGSEAAEDPEFRRAVEADLHVLMEEYGDLPVGHYTYGVLADAVLNRHTEEDLAMGQPAPEIVGTDVDGQPMRLSDFKGKVTVLDFWGDW